MKRLSPALLVTLLLICATLVFTACSGSSANNPTVGPTAASTIAAPVETAPREDVEATMPVATEPVQTQPVATEPVQTQPAATEPVATQPATTQAPHSHAYTESVTKEASCATEGEKTFTCACGDSYTEVIPANGAHNYSSKVDKEASCAADGQKTVTCSTCGHSYTDVIPATGAHNYSSKVDKEAGCVTEGQKTITCSTCGHSYTEAIPSNGGHNYTSKVTKEATCTADGQQVFTCKVCDDSYTETIPGGHKWVDATCTKPKTCSTCKETSGSAKGHDYMEATSTAPQTCRNCGDTVGTPVTWYEAGTYKVGTDIPAGAYFISCSGNVSAYMCISNDSNGKDIVENDNFNTHRFVEVQNGQYLQVKRGKFVSVDQYSPVFDVNNLTEGTYRVGTDIPAGEYIILNTTENNSAYMAILADLNGEDILENENFDTHHYVTVENGQLLEVHRGKPVPVSAYTPNFDPSNLPEGMYRVGIDIPAGEYKLIQDSKYMAYVCIYDNSTAERDIEDNDNFDGTQYVTVRSGQYLLLNRCYAVLVEEIADEPAQPDDDNGNSGDSGSSDDDDDSLWSFSEASDLNDMASNATDSMNKCVTKITNAMSNEQQAYKVLHYSQAVTYANNAKLYLIQIKDLADKNATLDMVAGSDYATLQDMIDYTLALCSTISDLEITSDNYADQADYLKDTAVDVYTLCLRIQKCTVDLMKAFTS